MLVFDIFLLLESKGLRRNLESIVNYVFSKDAKKQKKQTLGIFPKAQIKVPFQIACFV